MCFSHFYGSLYKSIWVGASIDISDNVRTYICTWMYPEVSQRTYPVSFGSPHFFKEIKISALALLKMVMHARSGGALEVMGMLIGKVSSEGTFRNGLFISRLSVAHSLSMLYFEARMLRMLCSEARSRYGRKVPVPGHQSAAFWAASARLTRALLGLVRPLPSAGGGGA